MRILNFLNENTNYVTRITAKIQIATMMSPSKPNEPTIQINQNRLTNKINALRLILSKYHVRARKVFAVTTWEMYVVANNNEIKFKQMQTTLNLNQKAQRDSMIL